MAPLAVELSGIGPGYVLQRLDYLSVHLVVTMKGLWLRSKRKRSSTEWQRGSPVNHELYIHGISR